MAFCRTMTSRLSPLGSSGTEELGAGRVSSRMFVLENTAVNSRKNTRITIMSIIGTMLRSLRPRYFAWLRIARAARCDEATCQLRNQAGRGAGARGAMAGPGAGAGSEYLSVIEFRNLTTA